MPSTTKGLKHLKMRQTHEELVIELLTLHDTPMKPKDIIALVQSRKRFTSAPTIRQVLMIATNKSLICRVKLEGFCAFYCLPSWFNQVWLKDKYKNKIYESKQIQVQGFTGSLGRTA